jgi:hypothetical protein
VLAATLSVLLTSCATSSDENALFGFSPDMAMSAGAASSSHVSPGPAVSSVFDFDEDDPTLPDAMSDLPQHRPGTEAAHAADEADSETPAQLAVAPANADDSAAAVPAEEIEAQPDDTDPPTYSQVAEAAERQEDTSSSSGGFLSAFFSPAPAGSAPPPAPQQPQEQARQAQPRQQEA